jgi:coenzyme F420-0:L-glutamate ligase/coenzyme F420-1:gamma-L-glutamate ligase
VDAEFCAFALPGLPLIQAGDDLAALIQQAAQAYRPLQAGDVLVVSSKIVSKAEGRRVALADVTPGAEALHYAQVTGKDPRLVELVLRESLSVSRAGRGVLVTQHRLGFVSANAGIDQSNVENGDEAALLLPHDPDASAEALRAALSQRAGVPLAVVISDTHGRPFRLGNVGVALGVAGLLALVDMRGQRDLFGRELKITQQGYADLLASAAHLLCGEAAEGRPVIVLRGLALPQGEGRASDLYRAPEHDMYR